MKKTLALLLCLGALLLAACGQAGGAEKSAAEKSAVEAAPVDSGTSVVLSEEGAQIRGGGVKAEGGTVTVGAVGEYRISGTLSDGQIIVDTGEDAMEVTLILEGVSVTNPQGPALWVKQAKKLTLQLADGSENLLVSGTEADLASYDDTRSGAALYAEDDLSVEGGGSLTVRGYLNNGVTCKDDVKIKGGSLDVLGANNGVRAAESVTVSGGQLRIVSGNDGLKTSSAEKAGKGFIEISGGSLSISSGGDAVAAITELRISGGELKAETRQDLVSTSSRKGLKAGTLVEISGGTLTISADEDGIHCDGSVRMSGGEASIVASTGIQAGVKDSGEGDILLSGGSLFVAAVKQGLKAEGSLAAGNELLALCGSEKQAEPLAGGQAWIRALVSGNAGDEVRVGASGASVTAPLKFRLLLLSSGELTQGEKTEVSVAGHSYQLTAR